MANNTSTAGALDWQAGMNALSQGRAEEAIAMLRPFVAANPNSFEGNNFLGVALSQTGKHDEGIVHLQNATRINSQSATARYNLGLAQQAAGRVESAKKEFQSAIQLDSKHSAAQIALAKIDAGLATPTSAPSTPATVNTPWAEGASAATPQMGAQQAAEIERASKPNVLNVLGGFGAGLVAAILCAVLWDKVSYYTSHQFGYAAIGVGFAVGTATILGASGKRGLSLQIVSGLMALFGILLGQTLLLMDLIRDEFATRGGMPANVNSFVLFFGSMVALPTFLKDNPLTFFFLAIGVYYGFTIPGKGKQTAKPTVEPMKSGAPSTSQAAPAAAMSSRPTPDSPFDAPPKV